MRTISTSCWIIRPSAAPFAVSRWRRPSSRPFILCGGGSRSERERSPPLLPCRSILYPVLGLSPRYGGPLQRARNLRSFRRDIGVLCTVQQSVVHEHQRHHGFGNRRALMPTQGSWRPLVSTVAGLPSLSIERRGIRMLDVGFMPIVTTMSCPVEIPPRMPPA